METEARLAAASAPLGAALGFLPAVSSWSVSGPNTQNFHPASGFPLIYLVSAWATLLVTYPATILVFYRIGRLSPAGLRTGTSLVEIYFAALAGQVLGQLLFYALPAGSGYFGVYSTLASAPATSLSFMFVAFGSFALSGLSRPQEAPAGVARWARVALSVALVFGAAGGFVGGALLVGAGSFDLWLYAEIGFLSFVFLVPVQFLAFYYLGRRAPVAGHTFRYFGHLFAGTYLGGVLGAAASVVLFGRGSWTLAAGQHTLAMVDGVVYQNVPAALQALFQYLNPIASLPFLAFFAMAVSRTSRSPPGPEVGEAGAPPAKQEEPKILPD